MNLDLRSINNRQFTLAKRMWTASVITNLSIYFLGIFTVFIFAPPNHLPEILLILAIISEVIQINSDRLKNNAETLLRKLDLHQSFGYDISEADKLNMFCVIPKKTRNSLLSKKNNDTYFASKTAPGPQKAIENLQESAWYTMQQTKYMSIIYLTLIFFLLIISIATLIYTLEQIDSITAQYQVVRVIIASLLLLVSLNMIKTVIEYFHTYQQCKRLYDITLFLLKETVQESEALKFWSEYHLTRASSPLLPDWLWKIKGDSLNQAWEQAKQG